MGVMLVMGDIKVLKFSDDEFGGDKTYFKHKYFQSPAVASACFLLVSCYHLAIDHLHRPLSSATTSSAATRLTSSTSISSPPQSRQPASYWSVAITSRSITSIVL